MRNRHCLLWQFCSIITSMDALHSVRVEKTAIIVSPLSDPSDDREYWLSRSPYERLQAVESLRQLNYGHGQSTARLQRVLEITQRVSGWVLAYRRLRRSLSRLHARDR